MTRDIYTDTSTDKPVKIIPDAAPAEIATDTDAPTVEQANAALADIGRTAERWLRIIGPVYLVGRAEAMQEAETDEPTGKAYNRALDRWAARVGFNLKLIDKRTRTALAYLAEHRQAFDVWWGKLKPTQRQQWCHPVTLQRHFSRNRKGGTGSTLKEKAGPTKEDLQNDNEALQRDIENLTHRNEDLSSEVEMMNEALQEANARVLIDFDHDSDETLTEKMMGQRTVLAEPRRFGALFRHWAHKCEQHAARTPETKPEPATKPRKGKRRGQEARP